MAKRLLELTLTCGCAVDVDEDIALGQSVVCPKHEDQQVKEIEPLCACGELLHYTDPVMGAYMVQLAIDQGEFIPMKGPGRGVWMVQRHFIALHGIKANELEGSEWEKVR